MSDSRVTLDLTMDEAIVFFDWLSRFNRQTTNFEDQAEQRVLWDLEAMLESVLSEPFESDYSEILRKARAAVRDATDPA